MYPRIYLEWYIIDIGEDFLRSYTIKRLIMLGNYSVNLRSYTLSLGDIDLMSKREQDGIKKIKEG